MAHEIETMAYFRNDFPGTAWEHRCPRRPLHDWQRACIKSGLDWEAELVPLLTADTQTKVDHRAVRRKTDGRILGTVGPRYHDPPEP